MDRCEVVWVSGSSEYVERFGPTWQVKSTPLGWFAKVEYGAEKLELMVGIRPTQEVAEKDLYKSIELITGASDG